MFLHIQGGGDYTRARIILIILPVIGEEGGDSGDSEVYG